VETTALPDQGKHALAHDCNHCTGIHQAQKPFYYNLSIFSLLQALLAQTQSKCLLFIFQEFSQKLSDTHFPAVIG
jgi:hypothetical protein